MDKKDWNYEAKTIFKKILEERNIKYNDLVHALNDRGIDESYNSIVTKVNRGTFSFSFFLECMYALDIDLKELDF